MENQPTSQPNADALIQWKTNAWKDPNMVAWYSQRMFDTSGTMRLHNALETGLCEAYARGPDVLDVGVGTGRGSLPLARKGYAVTGVDSSQAMLDECRRQAGDMPVTLLQGDVANLPVEDGRYDTVMALNVLTHFPHWQKVMGEWRNKVKPGGRLMFDIYSLDHLRHVRKQAVTAEDLMAESAAANFSMHIAVEDLAVCADDFGLKIVAVVPYAGLYSSKHPWGNTHRPLTGQHWWNRLLSWLAVDDGFLEFCLFLEQELFLRLSSVMTGRFLVVLEKTADKAANRRWLEGNAKLNEMLRSHVTLDTLAPYLALEKSVWRETLSRHLDHPRHLACFYYLWTTFWENPEVVDLESLVEERHARTLRTWRERGQVDQEAFAYAKQWQALPELAAVLAHNNINLGVGMAYDLTRALLCDGFRAFAAEGRA